MSARCVDCLNEAIERCEVTGVTLCAEHLYYVDDGRRVSERVAGQMRASGRVVHSPARYLAQLGSEYPPPRLPRPIPFPVRQLPNGYDFLGGAAALLCVASLLAGWLAATGAGAAWLAPIVAHVGVAAAALRRSTHAVYPGETRTAGIVGLIVSLGVLAGNALLALIPSP
jgi:hypothetical protein